MVDPGEEFGFDEPLFKVDDYKEMFTILSRDKAQQLLEKNYSAVSQTDIKLMSMVFKHLAYYILDEPEIASLVKLVKKTLHIDILTKATSMKEIAYSMSLYLALYPHFTTDYDAEL